MKHSGSCHCGQVAFEVEGQLDEVYDCNCSMCRRRGGLLWFRPQSAFQLLTDPAMQATYTFNKHVIQHHFCPRCGIAVYGQGTDPQGQTMVAVNVRCLSEVDLSALKTVPIDGASF